jgi:hypothetical protein
MPYHREAKQLPSRGSGSEGWYLNEAFEKGSDTDSVIGL